MLGLSSIFLFNFFLHVFCNLTKTSSDMQYKTSGGFYDPFAFYKRDLGFVYSLVALHQSLAVSALCLMLPHSRVHIYQSPRLMPTPLVPFSIRKGRTSGKFEL